MRADGYRVPRPRLRPYTRHHEDRDQMTIHLPVALSELVRGEAREREATISDIVRDALDAYFTNRGEQ